MTDDASNGPFGLHPFDGMDVPALLAERARRRGGHPLLIWAPLEGPAREWSYAAFVDEVARLAGGLRARGVGPGDRVLIHLDNCPESLVARFACTWIGAVGVLTNPAAAGPELSHLAGAGGCRAGLTQPRLAALVAASCPGLEWIAVTETDAGAPAAAGTAPGKSERYAALLAEPAPPRAPDPTAPALILYTTGTTSLPKGVVWTHANLLWGAKLGALQQGFRADDVTHIALPMFHVVGFSWSFLPTLFAGATALLQPRFSASRYWPAALAHRATLGAQVPFITRVLAGSPVPKHRFRQWTVARYDPEECATFGVAEMSGWGMTEMVAMAIIGDPWSDQRPYSMGRPSLGYRIHVEDDDGNPTAPGKTGNLLVSGVRGVSIFKHYDGRPEADAEAFDAQGRFRTGDRVRLDEDGWITFADRVKDVIKVGGEGVSAFEIEAVVGRVPGVRESAVVARPDPVYGEVAVAFVVLAENARDGEEAVRTRVFERCAAELARFKVPREVRIIAELPRIGFGKIHKVALREGLAAEARERAAGA